MELYELPSQGNYQCRIEESFELSLKDAKLVRIIEYENKSTNSETLIQLCAKQFLFQSSCEDFTVKIDEKISKASPIEKDFCVRLLIVDSEILLKPKEKIIVKIECIWRDFYYSLPNLNYTFVPAEKALYKLKINHFNLSPLLKLKINGEDAIEKKHFNLLKDNSIDFTEKEIGHDEQFHLKIISLNTPEKIVVLEEIRDTIEINIFEKFTFIIIQHLLADVLHLLNAFEKGGAKKESMFIVGIPYSTKYQTVNYLTELGYTNIKTPEKYPFDEDYVIPTMLEAIDYSIRKDKKIIVVEDGGYVVPLLHTKEIFQNHLKYFVGAVEQTANGIWRDRDLLKEAGKDLKIPVVNVAESKIKQKIESPLIGRAVTRNLELVYNKTFKEISGVKVGLIGYGSIGRQVCKNLKNLGSIVRVYDKETLNNIEARYDGIETTDNIIELLKNNDIIIEATGEYWSTESIECKNYYNAFKHTSIFASASSKRRGIFYEEFDKSVKSFELIPGIGVKYKMQKDNEITLIADGYPINFFLGESVPDLAIAFIIAWLYKSSELLAKNYSKMTPNFVDTNNKDDIIGFFKAQQMISKLHSIEIG